MGRPKKSAPVYVEPEEESQDVEEEEVDDEEEAVTEFNRAPSGGFPPIKKAEAVRRAVAANPDLSPAEGAAYVRQHFGVEMDGKTFSLNRSQLKSREAKKAAAAQPVAAPAAPRKQAAPAAPRQAAPATPSGGIIGDIADIKRLLATHGKDGLEELINVLG